MSHIKKVLILIQAAPITFKYNFKNASKLSFEPRTKEEITIKPKGS